LCISSVRDLILKQMGAKLPVTILGGSWELAGKDFRSTDGDN
jgi:hypothetical protein